MSAPNDQCDRCGIYRGVHDLRPAIGHAFVEPAAPGPQGDGDAAVRARLPHDFSAAETYAMCWCSQYSYHPIHGKTAREVYALGRAEGAREAKVNIDDILLALTEVSSERTELKSWLLELKEFEVPWIKSEGLLCCPLCDLAHHADDAHGTQVHERTCLFDAIARLGKP